MFVNLTIKNINPSNTRHKPDILTSPWPLLCESISALIHKHRTHIWNVTLTFVGLENVVTYIFNMLTLWKKNQPLSWPLPKWSLCFNMCCRNHFLSPSDSLPIIAVYFSIQSAFVFFLSSLLHSVSKLNKLNLKQTLMQHGLIVLDLSVIAVVSCGQFSQNVHVH